MKIFNSDSVVSSDRHFFINNKDVFIVQITDNRFNIYPVGEVGGSENMDLYFTVNVEPVSSECSLIRYMGAQDHRKCCIVKYTYALTDYKNYFDIKDFLSSFGAKSSRFAKFELVPIKKNKKVK